MQKKEQQTAKNSKYFSNIGVNMMKDFTKIPNKLAFTRHDQGSEQF